MKLTIELTHERMAAYFALSAMNVKSDELPLILGMIRESLEALETKKQDRVADVSKPVRQSGIPWYEQDRGIGQPPGTATNIGSSCSDLTNVTINND